MKLTILKQPRKFLERLTKNQQQRIYEAMADLPKGDVIPLHGEMSAYRLRLGDWRVVFIITEGRDEIIIRQIGNRGDIYKKL